MTAPDDIRETRDASTAAAADRGSESAATPFVVLSTQRTGSTWLIDTLNAHARIRCHGELFLADGTGRPPFGSQDHVFFEEYRRTIAGAGVSKQEAVADYLARVFSGRSSPDGSETAVGFKLMYGQAGAYATLLEQLRSLGARVVHLVRANGLAVLISKEVAVSRDLFHSTESTSPSSVRIRLSPVAVRRHLEAYETEIDKWRRRLDDLDFRSLEVQYEQLSASRETELERVADFLGVDNAFSAESRLKRLITEPYESVVENWDEVVAELRGTRFEWMTA